MSLVNHEAFVNWMIDELFKEKPFTMVLNKEQALSLYEVMESVKDNVEVKEYMALLFNAESFVIEINNSNADYLYHVLSTYLVKQVV